MDKKIDLSGAEPMWSRFIHAKGAALGLPIAGNFELTSNCNFNCKMCYVHTPNHKELLSASEWIKLGRAARDSGMVFLLLTGGEPLLRPDFKEIYGALIEMGLLISINTNASLVDDEMFEFFVKHPPLRMNISLYACTDEGYERLCGRPMAETVKNNIIRLHRAGVSVKLNSTVTPYNADRIEEIHAFAAQLGVPVQATTYMYPPVRIDKDKYGTSPARFNAEEAAYYLLKCSEQVLTPEQLRLNAAACIPDDDICVSDVSEGIRCRAGSTAFWVTWDGRMLPCGMFPHEGWNVCELGFTVAWEAVKAFAKTIRMPKECTDCPQKVRCGACAAACFAESGRSDVLPEYVCRMTKHYNKLVYEKYKEQ